MAQRDPVVGETPEVHGRDLARFAPSNRRRLSAPGMRTFLAIADLWGVNQKQRRLILGCPARSTYQSWCMHAREHRTFTLKVDVLMRISAVLGIHQSLAALLIDEHDGVDWLRQRHDAPVFGGHPPLDLIVSGTQDGLMLVRRFLDAACSGLYMPPQAADAAIASDQGEVIFL